MFLRYGSYTHALQEARVTIQRQPLSDAAGNLYGYREEWQIDGRLVADNAAAITSALAVLEAAYASGGQDLALLLPDGVTPSSHQLVSADCLGGTRIARPLRYPIGQGAEYSTFRTYSVAIEGDLLLSQAESPLLAHEETLSFSGAGGPRFVVIECRNGPPQMQMVSQRTPCRVVQRGRAIGLRQYPSPPGPIWPSFEQPEERRIQLTSPRARGQGAQRALAHYGISWSYQFLAPAPLAGLPHPQS